jgi:hypothetical protein
MTSTCSLLQQHDVERLENFGGDEGEYLRAPGYCRQLAQWGGFHVVHGYAMADPHTRLQAGLAGWWALFYQCHRAH